MNTAAPDWTRETMSEKFYWLVETVLDNARVDENLDLAWHFDDLGNVSELTEKLK